MSRKKAIIWAVVVGIVAASAAVFWEFHPWRPRSTVIQGAVIRKEDDPRRRLPVADVLVTAFYGGKSFSTQSDASGYFKIQFPGVVWPGQQVDLNFSSPNYVSLNMQEQPGISSIRRELYIAAMTPIDKPTATNASRAASVVSNIKVRYTVNAKTEVNVGSAVQTFQIINQANVPCEHQKPCSPNGYWKASPGTVTLDAGSGNEFRNVRASCIAGPCPFTRIDSSGFVNGGQSITASALDWSDTATFLVEAEVFRTGIGSSVRELYPVIYGRVLNFTLPPTQEGVSIEAELDGTPMVFPLGPNLYLSWAACTARTISSEDKSTVYRCELKQGYRF